MRLPFLLLSMIQSGVCLVRMGYALVRDLLNTCQGLALACWSEAFRILFCMYRC